MTEGPVRLSLTSVPPLHVPLRFFLTAPWLGVAAGAVLLAGGAAAWESRWMPSMLAAVHLLTLGVMLMVMFGALYQLMPVLTGRGIPGARVLAPLVHATLTLGALALAAALYSGEPALFWAAIGLVAAAFLAFVVPLAWRLAHRIGGGGAVVVIRLAAASLLVTVALGIYLAVGCAAPGTIPFRAWTDVHAGWGLAGWTLLLVIGVAFQVIPMFHVTPPFRRATTYTIAGIVFTALVAVSHAHGALASGLTTVVALAAAAWAVHALAVLARRRRRQREAMIGFWVLACCALLLACAVLLLMLWAPALLAAVVPAHRAPLLLGALAIVGFALSAIVGMQHKIIAFLAFVHLQRRCAHRAPAQPLPLLHELVPPACSAVQLGVHAATAVAVAAAALQPRVGPWAAAALVADFVLLAGTQVAALARYARSVRALAPAGDP